MADSRQRRQRLSAMSFVLWPALATLSSAFPQLFVPILMMFSFSFLFFHRFGFRFFLAYSSFSDFFVIVAALGSVAANDMLKWPKRFILPILCRRFASVLLHYYFCLSCSVLFHFSLRLALQFFDFALFPAFGICFACFPVLLLVIELSACIHPLPWSLWDKQRDGGSLNICTIFGPGICMSSPSKEEEFLSLHFSLCGKSFKMIFV